MDGKLACRRANGDVRELKSGDFEHNFDYIDYTQYLLIAAPRAGHRNAPYEVPRRCVIVLLRGAASC